MMTRERSGVDVMVTSENSGVGTTLWGVSVGPGDPELLTLKAVRIMCEADVIAVPDGGTGRKLALQIAHQHVADKPLLDCPAPMTRDAQALRAAHEASADLICQQLEHGQSVAFLCLGDVGVYSTFWYVAQLVRERGHCVQTVPGVTSFCAAAATLGTPLCAGEQRLTIAAAADQSLGDVLDTPGTKVIMKPGRSLTPLRDALAARGRLESSSLVSRCGLPDEQVFEHLADADDQAGYLSLAIVRETEA